MSRPLPDAPSIEYLRAEARDLHRAAKSGDAAAHARFHESHPRLSPPGSGAIDVGSPRLADAQLVLAREYGFPSWPRLQKHVRTLTAAGLLHDAIRRDDLAAVKALIEADRSLLTAKMGYGGSGPLTWAAECRGASPPTEARLAIARYLLDAGADVHAGGDGPLMRAALDDRRIPMMELLVDRGADVNALWNGFYPIIWAPCECLAPATLEWLLARGADPNSRPKPSDGTPLDMVIGTYARHADRQHRCARLLIDAGGRSRCDGLPVLEIHAGRLDRLAARLDADPGLVHHRFSGLDYGDTGARALKHPGSTLLHVAANYCDREAAELLLDRGADPNARAALEGDGSRGPTPLFFAVTQYGDMGAATAALLIERGADVSVRATVPGRYDFPDERIEVTPLGYAARFPSEARVGDATIDLLIARGAPAGDVYAAAKLGLKDELERLLAAGRDPRMTHLDGETAYHAAAVAGHREVCDLLRSAGAG